ncbi:MAG TPA: tetratricopeptide repeat protein [Spirochaetia bacterium]|nr:tetratricopeptide repeat protein [Spirochaetia bacterium]
MPVIIVFIIILGIAVGIITFFLIKSIIAPKRVSNLATLLKQGKASTVTRIAKQIIAKEPRNAEAHYFLGQAYADQGKPELALMEYKIVNQISNFSSLCPEVEFRRNISELYKRFNQPEEALKEYLLLIKLEPDVADYYFKAGELFEEREKTDKAEMYYRKAIELEPQMAIAHYKLGYLLYRIKKLIEAKAELEITLKLEPDNYSAFFYLGKIIKENHDYVAALLAFEKAERDPDLKVKALVERGGCYMSMNSFDKAIPELERAVKLATNDSATEVLYGRYFLAVCYEKIRDIDKAVEQWEKIYLKKPTFKDVAEKLSQYQDFRTDDRMKDYLTSPVETFHEISKALTVSMGLSIRDLSDIPNGCQIVAVESESKWRNAKKIPKILRFLRVPEMITETTVRALYEEMKNLGVSRGVIISSSNFSRKAIDFAESRPIDLINKDQLQDELKKLDFSSLGRQQA